MGEGECFFLLLFVFLGGVFFCFGVFFVVVVVFLVVVFVVVVVVFWLLFFGCFLVPVFPDSAISPTDTHELFTAH